MRVLLHDESKDLGERILALTSTEMTFPVRLTILDLAAVLEARSVLLPGLFWDVAYGIVGLVLHALLCSG